ncbi:hypothetical protein [Streptosporangium sandarakinum]|uniref:hypothetical protein n=1 Tax=Streptosporangium sandarakinum TaxID=1260955 RepID=UPI0037ABC2C6
MLPEITSAGGYTTLAVAQALAELGWPPAAPKDGPSGERHALVLTWPGDPAPVFVEWGRHLPYRLDALPWALASGHGGIDVLLGGQAPAPVPLKCEDDLRTAALRLAETVRDRFAGRPAPLVHLPEGPPPLLPYGLIDWSAPARRTASLIRALGSPAPGAWTSVDGMRLTVGSAGLTDLPSACAPPGTVLAADGDGLLVQAGDGILRIGDVRDLIGPVCPPPDSRLGRDVAGETEVLRQRVTDLEHMVRYLARCKSDGV